MGTASGTIANSANRRGAETGTDFSVSGIHSLITEIARDAQPRKTWAFLCDLLGVTERVAKHRLAGSRAYTVEELQAMLQSEHGFEILQALMGDAQPKWWWWAQRVIATAERRRQAAELDQEILLLETSRPPDVNGRRRIKGDLDARTTLNRKFAETETALGVLRPDVNRAPDRAVAQAKGRRA